MTNAPTPLSHDYEEDEISLLDTLVALAESWKLLVLGPLVIGLLAGVLSLFWPNTYESVSILRLDEEELALIHSTPVLDPLIVKFDLLKESDGFYDDARRDLIKKLVVVFDKKTKLATFIAKARTPQQAKALGVATIELLLEELRAKGGEKEAILKEIAINQQAITLAEDALDSLRKSFKHGVDLTDRQQEAVVRSFSLLTVELISRTQANNNLARKLEVRGEEVYVQKASLPERHSGPKRISVLIISVLVSEFVLLLFVFVRKAWQRASQGADASVKIAFIKKSLGLSV